VSVSAGQPAPAELLIDPERLIGAYYDQRPDPEVPEQRVSFCTSGHRRTSLDASGKAACAFFLKAIPTALDPINNGLPTLQFQSVTINQKDPTDLIGGTQDNGTWAFDCSGGLPCQTFETINGDGGQSAIDATTPSTRTHSYYFPQYDTNFNTNNPTGWDWISDPFLVALNNGEAFSFYPPFIQDPTTHGYEYTAGQHVYRTTDDGLRASPSYCLAQPTARSRT